MKAVARVLGTPGLVVGTVILAYVMGVNYRLRESHAPGRGTPVNSGPATSVEGTRIGRTFPQA